MEGQQPQYQQQPYQQPPPQPMYAPHQPFKLPKIVGYILIMVALIFLPMGMIIAINAEGTDYADSVKLGMNIMQIGVLLDAVFTMLFLGLGNDLDKFEKLGLIVMLGIVFYATTLVRLSSSIYG